ncbi:MAG: hypothetical protein D6766_09140, partial [Verrucomicrobia bacterium]
MRQEPAIGTSRQWRMISALALLGVTAAWAAEIGPPRIGRWPGPLGGPAESVQVVGQTAYVAVGGGGLLIVDVSDPAHPTRLGGHDTDGIALDVALSGNRAFVADGPAGVVVLDVSDPAHPVPLGHHDTEGEALAVAVSGRLAFVADGPAGLVVLDVSDPANPVRLVSREAEPYRLIQDVAVSGDRAFVVDTESSWYSPK